MERRKKIRRKKTEQRGHDAPVLQRGDTAATALQQSCNTRAAAVQQACKPEANDLNTLSGNVPGRGLAYRTASGVSFR